MSDKPTSAGGLLARHFMLLEAVASVSLSHPGSCNCLTCRAAMGDEDAMTQIALDLELYGLL